MQGPLVSILIPVFNAERSISNAIESCLNQSYLNIEILILDDASTDHTVQEITKYENIILLKHEKNLGIPSARNTLLKAASGQYIAWLDADDRMVPNRIERQVKFMLKNPNVDIAGSWIYTDSKLLPLKKMPTENAMITAHLWFKNCMVQPGIISKNFYLTEQLFYNTVYFFMQDYELWFRLRNKKVFANIPEFLTFYHVSSLDENERKHMSFQTMQIPDKLWSIKWAESDFNIDEKQKELLQLFLSNSAKISAKEAKILRNIFKIMMEDKTFGKVKENEWMIHLYRLLLFKRLSFVNRIFNLNLLNSLFKYPLLKKMHLIQ